MLNFKPNLLLFLRVPLIQTQVFVHENLNPSDVQTFAVNCSLMYYIIVVFSHKPDRIFKKKKVYFLSAYESINFTLH